MTHGFRFVCWTAIAFGVACSPAFAAERAPRPPAGMPDPGIFAPFLTSNSAECVSMKSVTDAGAKFVPLKEDTFRFVQALYVAIPPMSKELPPGDKAVLAIGPSGEIMVAIVSGEQTCARFMVPGFITEMIANVESGNQSSAVPGKDL